MRLSRWAYVQGRLRFEWLQWRIHWRSWRGGGTVVVPRGLYIGRHGALPWSVSVAGEE